MWIRHSMYAPIYILKLALLIGCRCLVIFLRARPRCMDELERGFCAGAAWLIGLDM